VPQNQVDEPSKPLVDLASALPTPNKEDLWMRIRKGFGLGELDSPLIGQHENWYANRPDYVGRMMDRSQLYLFHIVEEVQRRGLPTEIALLPMIESAFNPKAYSTGRASGIWQFIPSTGKNFGLDQNWWYDGRRNVLSATNAALDYLQKLHGMFGSWELALAAYNCGEGTVARAIAVNRAKGLPTDYLSLRLPPESRNYVPKLLAIKHIVANPEAFRLTLNDVPNKPFFTTVRVRKHIDVALAARFADITLEEFTALNPAYTRPVITYKDNEVLLLPSSKVAIFKANMQRYGDRQLHSWQAYQGRRGERVDKIAHKFEITVAQLHHLNSVQEKRGKLKMAQLLLVPLKLVKPLPTAAQIATTKLPTPSQNYLVQKGDTLYALARRFGTTVETLQNHNHLDGNDVNVGSTIEISVTETKMLAENDVSNSSKIDAETTTPAAESPAELVSVREVTRTARPAVPVRRSFYTVKRGDTLLGIAQAFQVAVKDLRRWNNLRSKSRLMPGSKIRVVSIH
jgi:membrane-bound lytic murein transglycosylase D